MVRSASIHNAIDGYTQCDEQNIAQKRSRESARFMDRPPREYDISQLSQVEWIV